MTHRCSEKCGWGYHYNPPPAKSEEPPPSLVSWDDLYKRLADIRRIKQNDYTGGQPDDMANYRNAAEFVGRPMWEILLARMQEKEYRLKMLLGGTKRQVPDETVADTCVDIANLALLLGKEYSGKS